VVKPARLKGNHGLVGQLEAALLDNIAEPGGVAQGPGHSVAETRGCGVASGLDEPVQGKAHGPHVAGRGGAVEGHPGQLGDRPARRRPDALKQAFRRRLG